MKFKLLNIAIFLTNFLAFLSSFLIIFIVFFVDLKLLLFNENFVLNQNLFLYSLGGILMLGLFIIYLFVLFGARRCSFTGQKFDFLEKSVFVKIRGLSHSIRVNFEGLTILSEMQHLEILHYDTLRKEFYIDFDQATFLTNSNNEEFLTSPSCTVVENIGKLIFNNCVETS